MKNFTELSADQHRAYSNFRPVGALNKDEVNKSVIDSLRKGNAQLNEENEQLLKENERLRRIIEVKQQSINAYTTSVRNQRSDIERMRAAMNAKDATIEGLRRAEANPAMMTTPLGLLPVTPAGMRRLVDAFAQDEVALGQLRSRMKEYTENLGRLFKENARFEAIFQGIIETLKEFDPKTMDENA